MANELKIGNKLVILNNATNLAQLSADPSPAVNGDMYYNSGTNQFRVYQNGTWQNLQAGGTVTLTGQALNSQNIIVGNGSNLSAALDTSSVGDVLADATNGLTLKSGVVFDSNVALTAAINRSKLATGNANRLVINNPSGVMSDASAITAARALISDANGIPTHSVTTDTELSYLSGVTSAVQTQIDSKVAKAGDAMTGNLTFSDTFGIDSTSSGNTLNIGASNALTINIGRTGATINLLGSVTEVKSTNLQVDDALITINKNGPAASANGAGIEIEEGGSITGYLKVANSRASWDLLAPATAGTVRFTPGALSIVIDQNLAVASSPTFVDVTLSGGTANRALAFDSSKNIVASATTDTELGYLSGVTSAIQTQLNGKASTALSNLASTAVNADIVPASDGTVNLGSSSFNWTQLNAKNVRSNTILALNANDGASAINVRSLTFRRSKDGTNFVESEYVDSATLAANTSSPTAISGLSFAFASFEGCILEYKIKEATTNKVRIGQLIVSVDSGGATVSSADQFSETGVLGNASGLVLSAAINGSNVDITYNNTHATNACTMRVDIKRLRA